MAIYNLSNVTIAGNANDLGAIATAVNILAEGVFGIGLLIVVFMIVFLSTRSNSDMPMSMAMAMWATSIVAFLGNLAGGLVTEQIMFTAFILTAIATVLLWIMKRE